MLVLAESDDVRDAVRQTHRVGNTVALVPTMGNLHAGHLALVSHARAQADYVVVSIFVNPMQFGPDEDLSTYPRTLEQDLARLEQAGVDCVFTPTVDSLYPAGIDETTFITVPVLSDILCGASRQGHFTGVATVVNRLFNIVQPDIAVFGEKDYQQLLVIRKMVADCMMPIEILSVPIMREADGLAMSSRNGYLDPQQREQAAALYRTLSELRTALQQAAKNYSELLRDACKSLEDSGFSVDYLELRDAADLRSVDPQTEEMIILAAAFLGNTRLIDNLRV